MKMLFSLYSFSSRNVFLPTSLPYYTSHVLFRLRNFNLFFVAKHIGSGDTKHNTSAQISDLTSF